METRPPPMAPPPYVQAVSRAYNKPLRPVVLFTSAISLIWSLVLAVKFVQDRQSDTETKRMKVFDLILSILFFIVAGLEVFGIVAATTQRIVLARIYFILAGLGAFVTFSAELIRLIAHFVVKRDLIDDCRNELTGAKAETLSGAIASIDGQEALRLCEDDWQRGLWWDLGWLVLTSCLALLFTGIVGAYYHQLLDPSFTRTTASDEQADQRARGATDEGVNVFPMEPYRQMTYHTPHQQDMPFVPPQYTLPPEYRLVYGAPGDHGPDDKKDGLERVSLSDNPPSRS